jgi:hypothetical protein
LAVNKLQKTIGSLENSVDKRKNSVSTLEVYINMHSQTISAYDHLKTREFGLRELNFPFDNINETAEKTIHCSNKSCKQILVRHTRAI